MLYSVTVNSLLGIGSKGKKERQTSAPTRAFPLVAEEEAE